MPNQEQSREGIPQKDENAQRPSADDEGDGPGKIGLNFKDGDMARPYGHTARTGGTWDEKKASEAGELGSPGVGMSDHSGPSDPDAKRSR